MPLFDLPLESLRGHRSAVTAPVDLEQFWATTLATVRGHDLDVQARPYDSGLSLVDVFDVTFRGFGGDRVSAWLIVPRGVDGPLPCVVRFIGYGGGRGDPTDWLPWPVAGYATLVMDTRGQGSEWSSGVTADPHGSGPHAAGFLTKGLESPQTYYYRRVYSDAVRAVEAARTFPSVDPARVSVAGGSQGGGIALAAAALDRDVHCALVDVPFLCDMRRASELTDKAPYQELVTYLGTHRDRLDQAFDTLAYFDGAVLAALATAPAIFSVGLMDDICPPSTVFAAYNAYAGVKSIEVYPYNGHEGGDVRHLRKQLAFMTARTASPGA